MDVSDTTARGVIDIKNHRRNPLSWSKKHPWSYVSEIIQLVEDKQEDTGSIRTTTVISSVLVLHEQGFIFILLCI